MNKKRKLVNPFLFLLAKRMLDYEFVQLGKIPSDLKLAQYIYDKHKRKKYEKTNYSDSPSVRDSIAFSKAERIRKFVLAPKDFMISEEMLNYLVAEISTLFNGTWEEFVDLYRQSNYAILGKIHMYAIEQRKRGISPDKIYEAMPIEAHSILDRINIQENSFTEKDYSQYLAYANDLLFRIHSRFVADDAENFPSILIRKKDPVVIARTANAKEVKYLELWSKNNYKYPVPFLKKLTAWHLENKDVYFYFLTKDRMILGGCALLPLNDRAYHQLKIGELEKNKISEDDLLLSHKVESDKYILFEFLFSNKRANYSSKFDEIFKELIRKYAAHFSYNELTIGAIASTEYELEFLEKQGFTRNDKVCHSKDGETISIFYELSWIQANDEWDESPF